MNEKIQVPQAEKIVGDVDDFDPYAYDSEKCFGEFITDPTEILKKLFHENSTLFIEPFEIEKTERDFEIINLVTDSIKTYTKHYGRNNFIELTSDHIHYFEENGVKEMTNDFFENGMSDNKGGQLIVDRGEDLETAILTFHELWHILASYTALQVTTEGEIEIYRSGFSVVKRDGSKAFFNTVDEALTGYATKKFFTEILRSRSDFQDSIAQREVDGKEVDTSRKDELATLLKYIDSVYEKNKDNFKNRDEIIDMFMRAQVTGNILPVGRLIENTFGRGAFRKLDEL